MPASPPLSIEFDRRRFNAATSKFLRRLAPAAVDRAVRKMAFDVAAETVKGLNGVDGLPKRIDTGRLRAAWAVAVTPVSGRAAGPVGDAKAGDGTSTMSGHGLARQASVTNNVEYAPYVEDGTGTMAAGHHLARAFRVVGNQARALVGDELIEAWHG